MYDTQLLVIASYCKNTLIIFVFHIYSQTHAHFLNDTIKKFNLLKQLKSPTCFGSYLNHIQEGISYFLTN